MYRNAFMTIILVLVRGIFTTLRGHLLITDVFFSCSCVWSGDLSVTFPSSLGNIALLYVFMSLKSCFKEMCSLIWKPTNLWFEACVNGFDCQPWPIWTEGSWLEKHTHPVTCRQTVPVPLDPKLVASQMGRKTTFAFCMQVQTGECSLVPMADIYSHSGDKVHQKLSRESHSECVTTCVHIVGPGTARMIITEFLVLLKS